MAAVLSYVDGEFDSIEFPSQSKESVRVSGIEILQNVSLASIRLLSEQNGGLIEHPEGLIFNNLNVIYNPVFSFKLVNGKYAPRSAEFSRSQGVMSIHNDLKGRFSEDEHIFVDHEKIDWSA